MRTCSVDDCTKPPRTKSADLCPMHYHRWYRHGKLEANARNKQTGPGRRYRTRHDPDHPMAMANGTVYVHRAVLYDQLGPGPHPCHWCTRPLEWNHEDREHALQVDHLNSVGDDNRPANLVASCLRCNVARGAQARHQRLLAAGWWENHDTVGRSTGRKAPVA